MLMLRYKLDKRASVIDSYWLFVVCRVVKGKQRRTARKLRDAQSIERRRGAPGNSEVPLVVLIGIHVI